MGLPLRILRTVHHTGPVVDALDALFASVWVSCGCATTVLPDGCADGV